MLKIKKGDNILVLKGKDRGKTGKVARVFLSERKIIVEGINLITKHIKPKTQGQKGEKIHIAAPIDISNVKLICPSCLKATRVGFEKNKQKKLRICKKCKKTIN